MSGGGARPTGAVLARATLGALAALVAIACGPKAVAQADPDLSDEQLAVMLFVDQGRSYGYQTMMARIQVETVRAELERDAQLLAQKEELYRKNATPLIELEIAQLKDAWNRKQLVVAEKSLDYVSAEYDAMGRMARHFGEGGISARSLYEVFRRGWDAGCDKGPDEVVAMQAWAEFMEKSLERARQLHAEGNEPLVSVLEKEAQLRIARANYENRLAGLEKCRTVLFPSLEDILAIAD